MTFKCILFFKKCKMRFEQYLVHFRPFWTSKSDLKIVQKSIKNRPGNKHWILQSFELHFFTSKWEHNEKRSKKVSQNRVGKMLARVTWRPLWPKEDPRWTPEAPKWSSRPQNDLKMTPKGAQNDIRMFQFWIENQSWKSCHCRLLRKKMARVLSGQRRSSRREMTAQYTITEKHA